MPLEIEKKLCSFVKKTLSFTGSNKVLLFESGINQIININKKNKEYQKEMGANALYLITLVFVQVVVVLKAGLLTLFNLKSLAIKIIFLFNCN